MLKSSGEQNLWSSQDRFDRNITSLSSNLRDNNTSHENMNDRKPNDSNQGVEISNDRTAVECAEKQQDVRTFLTSLYHDLDNIILDANRNRNENLNLDQLILVDKIKSLGALIKIKDQQIQVSIIIRYRNKKNIKQKEKLDNCDTQL